MFYTGSVSYTHLDVYKRQITDSVKVSGDKVDKDKAGKYTVTYEVSDSSGNKSTATRAVSYTHLDVYKRQILDGRPVSELKEKELTRVRRDTIGSVSYTHLDVYKRQM